MRPPPKPPRSDPPAEVLVDFDIGEPDTIQRNHRVRMFGALASIYDHVGEERFTVLVEIAAIFAEASRDDQDLIRAVARRLNGERPFP